MSYEYCVPIKVKDKLLVVVHPQIAATMKLQEGELLRQELTAKGLLLRRDDENSL